MNKAFKILVFLIFSFNCVTVFAQKKKSKKSNQTQQLNPKKEAKNKKVATKNMSSKKVKREVKKTIDNTPTEVQATSTISLSKDTTKPSVVTITSSFKPQLRTAAKINFAATTPELDTTKLNLNYSIPAQNLFFSYQPVPIKPLSLSADSSFEWHNNQYIKVGFGNYTTPYVETGLAFGHPNQTLVTINGNYVSSKGKINFQEFTKARLQVAANFGAIPNHELITSVAYNLSSQYKYGTLSGYTFSKDDLQQTFNSIDVSATLSSKKENNFGISYQPQVNANYFFDNKNAKETNVIVNAPVSKSITKNLKFTVVANADISSYSNTLIKTSNNIFSIAPNLNYNNNIFKVNIGFKPTWNNSKFAFLPNIFGEYKFASEKLSLTAGWLGYFQKNNYKNLAAINPFIEQPTNFLNTKIDEQFVGIKGGVGKHFNFNGQVSFLKFTNQALFTNDDAAINAQTFKILYEPNLKAVRIAGEIAYTTQEKFSFVSAIKYTQFTGQDSFPKAYGIVPLEVSSSLKYKVLKDVFVKADLFLFTGNYYKIQTIQSEKTSAAFDFNLGAEYKVLNKLNVYLDFNNLFNNQYQRWHQYNVLGFNIVAGVVYLFH